jgi:membrane protein implicated in regulation of membrane protease activity
MGQLAFVVLVVVAGAVGWRMLKREQARVAERLREAENRSRTGTLEKDPATGVYRPVDREP